MAALAACGGGEAATGLSSAGGGAAQVNGPASDYPVVIGQPYRVGDVNYVPVDTLNYDEVGYAEPERGAAPGVWGSHHTLPLPSYVEVTSLETGRTILLRLQERGPMETNALISLSPDALAQIGATGEIPVRVRRVNPPEEQRALLRSGQRAPLRMDTPETLVTVLKRKLPAQGASTSLTMKRPLPSTIAPVDPNAAFDREPAPEPESEVALTESPVPSVPPALPPMEEVEERAPAISDGFIVQAAAFSTRDRADKVANVLGGEVSQSGQYFRVRTGPFATRGQAEASLAKVKAAGYTDARIFTKG